MQFSKLWGDKGVASKTLSSATDILSNYEIGIIALRALPMIAASLDERCTIPK